MNQRIIGFDLARAYAIFGMFVVNFNFCFGTFSSTSTFEKFQNLFVGNSTAIFIILAGVGLSLMTSRLVYTLEEKKKIKSTVLKRSWFLFALGLLLYPWWPGDILHFYGGYLHLAAFLLFVPRRYYLWAVIAAILIFHALLFFIPIGTGWDFVTTEYTDFWSLKGFLRNTFYNGWNSMFPWFAYFALGMWLGRLKWQDKKTRKNVFIAGLLLFIVFQILRLFARNDFFSEGVTNYIMSEYFPPYFPFIAITIGFALMVISTFLYIGERFATSKLILYLAVTGRMTLTHYVVHLTLGMLLLSLLTGEKYTGYWNSLIPTNPVLIFTFSFLFFIVAVIFSNLWNKRFKNGPVEMLMRKFSDK